MAVIGALQKTLGKGTGTKNQIKLEFDISIEYFFMSQILCLLTHVIKIPISLKWKTKNYKENNQSKILWLYDCK